MVFKGPSGRSARQMVEFVDCCMVFKGLSGRSAGQMDLPTVAWFAWSASLIDLEFADSCMVFKVFCGRSARLTAFSKFLGAKPSWPVSKAYSILEVPGR